MSYTATWENGLAGRLRAGVERLRLCDPQELLAAVNRRRLLTYQQELSSQQEPRQHVDRSMLGMLRAAVTGDLLAPPEGTVDGPPPTPGQMRWLWPLSDGDAGKVIVSGAGEIGAGEVGLFQRLNGTGGWTDTDFTAHYIRAEHWNELRQAMEWLCRGRWRLPVYFWGGMFSLMPDLPWISGFVARDEESEVRTTGLAVLQSPAGGGKTMGLCGVTCLATSRIELTTDCNCQLDVYRCLRNIEFLIDPPCWNAYSPNSALAWQQPGGLGAQDAQLIGTVPATEGQPAVLTGAAVAGALQAMVDGAPCGLTVRRADSGPETVEVTAELVVEFDINSPPN